MDNIKSILIIGKPGSAKTTFLAQFVIIARKAKSAVKFWKTPENIQPIVEAIKKLRNATETETTHATDNHVIILPVTINGSNLELKCPDYGGEQINEMLNIREINTHWSELINNSNSWIVFIRPQKLETIFDLSNKTASKEAPQKDNTSIPSFKPSEQSTVIELIQMMLSIKKVGYQIPINTPQITIALTCWDEIEESITPISFLEKNLPLLNQFLINNWQTSAFKVIGISAQGFRLNTEENKEKYMGEGPDKFAFIVRGNSTERIMDLTVLIQEAI